MHSPDRHYSIITSLQRPQPPLPPNQLQKPDPSELQPIHTTQYTEPAFSLHSNANSSLSYQFTLLLNPTKTPIPAPTQKPMPNTKHETRTHSITTHNYSPQKHQHKTNLIHIHNQCPHY
ncbi:hypothetical protein KC19_4G066500 [Ceratodon purpureus]|uniref:Uncharacterized protein n=1 Tax=Ceratodon purpureus TaxID=3225 RepID=A0A8T0I5T4_CERPU|nr:hypothetical protein KC19_4G066500 [Ceratodon purpureus]